MKKIVLAVGVLGLVASAAAVGCGGSDDDPAAAATAGSGGSGTAGKAGSGGTTAGSGGTTAGSGGTTAGSGGTAAGAGGSTAGAGGSTAGSGGTTAGAGGSTAGAGGSTAGAGGSTAGAGGSTAGAGGSTAGAGGSTAGAGGGGGAGGALPTDFSCVPVAGPDPKPASTTVTFDFYVTDYLSKKPIDAYVLKACKKDDATCATPLDTKTSDVNGKVTFTVTVDAAAPGFDGYIDATDPLKTTYYPTLYAYGNHAAIGQLAGTATWSVAVFPKAIFGAATASLSIEKMNGHGHVLQVTRDCNWNAAVGVAVAPTAGADAPKTVIRYTKGAGLDPNATVTSDSGASFVFNLLAGNATIDAQVPMTGGPPNLLLGSVTVPVRQDTLTVTSWYPKPIPVLPLGCAVRVRSLAGRRGGGVGPLEHA